MKKLLAFAFFMLLIFAEGSTATTVQSGQETIDVIIEDGNSRIIFLGVNSDGGESVTTSGSIYSWTMLGSDNEESITFPASGTQWLRINITVPDNQELGDYSGTITTDGTVLSTIRVTVTLSTAEIESLKTLSDVENKISSLESNIDSYLDEQLSELKEQINTIKSELSLSIQSIKEYEQEIRTLRDENEVLDDSVEELNTIVDGLESMSASLNNERESLVITGNMLRVESNILFVVGILIGAAGIYLFYRKTHKYL